MINLSFNRPVRFIDGNIMDALSLLIIKLTIFMAFNNKKKVRY